MSKEPIIYIKHILECIELIEKYIEGKNKVDFIETPLIQDAIIHRIEIIGEAIKNLSSEFLGNYPDIPWKEIKGMRDIIVHKYFGIDLELTWEVVEKDIPDLKSNILKIKKEMALESDSSLKK
ncbi:MAG: DUF86 domain-containing protein [Promethearchaeota archaeon]|nr:MAG: DUF86 domain-containing protein [Candidatus Lokiarchaeota archaeon]